MAEKDSVPFLSIVIPAFNERDRLPQTLASFLDYLNSQTYSSEIVVVDDGSADNTVSAIAIKFSHQVKLIQHPHNMGKGAAVRTGVLASTGRQVLFSDADGSTPISELSKLQAEIAKGYDVAIGTRRDSALVRQKQPFYRGILGEGFNVLAKIAIGQDIQDTQCGFKLLDGVVCRQLFRQIQIQGFGFDVELLYLAVKHNYKIAQVPVVWINDTRSKVRIWKDPFVMFADLIKIKQIHAQSNFPK